MPELSASTGWNGGGSYGRAKDRRKLYVATAGISGCITGVPARASATQSPVHVIWSSERSKAWHGVR